MQGARDDFLADAAFAGDQHRNGGLGRALAQGLDHAHRLAVADHVVEGGAARGALLQAADLGGQLGHLQGVADADQQAVGADRLDEEVLGAGLHGLDHRLYAAVGRQHDDRRGHARRAHLGQGLHARQAGHDEIQKHNVGAAALGQTVDGLAPAFGVDDRIAFTVEHRLNQAALRGIIVDDQNGLGHWSTPFNITIERPSSLGRDWLVSTQP